MRVLLKPKYVLATRGTFHTFAASTKNYIIHQPEDVLRSMNTWCMKTHDQSGLINACLQSKLTEKEVEDEVKKFLEQHTEKNQCPLAGNSVYMDKLFLIKYMPDLADFLHYRIVDVSTVKELCRRWNPSIFWKAPAKKLVHRALDDITESIEELKYYKKFMFARGMPSTSSHSQLTTSTSGSFLPPCNGFRRILSRNFQTLKLLQVKFPGAVRIREEWEDADRKETNFGCAH
uniref:Uncharacterized protein n=1 Tax=Phlebotomus papatasi TaxID=29031 RepID=A0A1B0DLC3_PHLPP